MHPHKVLHGIRDGQRQVVVFRGTPVLAKFLFDYLNAGESINSFLEAFPAVTDEQVRALLDLAKGAVLSQVHEVKALTDEDPAALASQMIDFAITEAFITENDDRLPYGAADAFWESLGLDGEGWPADVARLKRTVDRLAEPALKKRAAEHLAKPLVERREQLVNGLLALAESLEEDKDTASAFAAYWDERGYEAYAVPAIVQQLKNEIEAEVAAIIERKALTVAQAAFSSDVPALARELVSFYKERRHQSPYFVRLETVSEEFWRAKGLRLSIELPPDLDDKYYAVEHMAEELIEEAERQAEEAEREIEQRQLEALVPECVQWARDRNMKKVTLQDAELFLLRRGQDVSKEGMRSLYLEANDQLRSRG